MAGAECELERWKLENVHSLQKLIETNLKDPTNALLAERVAESRELRIVTEKLKIQGDEQALYNDKLKTAVEERMRKIAEEILVIY